VERHQQRPIDRFVNALISPNSHRCGRDRKVGGTSYLLEALMGEFGRFRGESICVDRARKRAPQRIPHQAFSAQGETGGIIARRVRHDGDGGSNGISESSMVESAAHIRDIGAEESAERPRRCALDRCVLSARTVPNV